ncbi:MAG: hypothetical protein ACXWG9_18115 [Usitatibacter sp.]
MNRGLRWLLSFSRLPLYLPIVIAVIYLVPGLYGLEKFQTPEARRVIEIVLVALVVYGIAQRALGPTNVLGRLVNSAGRIPISDAALTVSIVGAYVIVSLTALISAPHIAMLEAMQGATSADLEFYRELMYKAREGPEMALGYLNSILTLTLMPYVICLLYWTGNRYRHVVLGLFVIFLLPSMEKALILRALIPLVFLFANIRRADRPPMRIAGLFLAALAVIYMLTSMTVSRDPADLPQEMSPYAVFDLTDPFQYVLNRIFWIPYVTAYDYLRYFDMQLENQYLMGRSIGALSMLLGFEKLNVEREVFAFQWGQNEAGTGSANTAYFIDAFINFGWIGVVVYTLAVVLIVRSFMASDNIPAKAVFGYHCIFLATSSLTGTLFSGGMLLLVMLVVFVRRASPPLRQASAVPEVRAAMQSRRRRTDEEPELPAHVLDLPDTLHRVPAVQALPDVSAESWIIPEPPPGRVSGAIVLYRHPAKQVREVVDSILMDGALDTLYLMDNGGMPAEYADIRDSRVIYHDCGANLGFGKAHNIAIALAMEGGARYHIVINPDVQVRDKAITKLREAMERDPSIGLISPQLLNPDGSVQHLCKLLPTPYDLAVRRFGTEAMRKRNDWRFTLRESGYGRPMQAPSLPGAFMFMRLSVLRQVGGFDERYFMYLEDLDICRRIGRAAKTVFFPDAQVMHAHGRGSYHSLGLLATHIRSVFLYFGTYGWFFDRERRAINREVLEALSGEAYFAPRPIHPDGVPET